MYGQWVRGEVTEERKDFALLLASIAGELYSLFLVNQMQELCTTNAATMNDSVLIANFNSIYSTLLKSIELLDR